MEQTHALEALISQYPKSHREGLVRAFDLGRSVQSMQGKANLREALQGLFDLAGMDIDT